MITLTNIPYEVVFANSEVSVLSSPANCDAAPIGTIFANGFSFHKVFCSRLFKSSGTRYYFCKSVFNHPVLEVTHEK